MKNLKGLPFAVALALTTMTWSCAGDDGAQEPVAKDNAAAPVPDAPGGQTGETADKPAGEGQANPEAAAAPAAAADTATAEPPAATTPAEPAGSGEMTVTAGVLNVRSGPGRAHPIIRALKRGEKVAAASGCKGGWCQIGDKEFVSKKYLKAAR